MQIFEIYATICVGVNELNSNAITKISDILMVEIREGKPLSDLYFGDFANIKIE